jgi:DNA-binding ferritin-like protein
MSDWRAYVDKTAGLTAAAGKALKAAKPVLGKGLSTVAEGGALGLGIGATEYMMNKKMRAMDKKLQALEHEKASSVKEAYEVQDYVGRDGKVYSSYATNRADIAEGWKRRGMTPVQHQDGLPGWNAEEEVTDPSQLASARNILAQRQQRKTEKARPGRAALGATMGGLAGGFLGAGTKRPALALGGAALGALGGGIMGYKTAGLSYENVFQRLMAYLRALYELHQWMHWRTKGQTFYGDHQLFQRMYEKVADELDGLAEKAIGLSNNVDVIDPKGNAVAAADVLEDFQFSPEGALAAERGFIGLVKDVRDNLGENLTDGLDNFLQGLSDTHEGHIYLLQQRTPTAQKVAALDRSLGAIYQKYGPPLEKSAAASFYSYRLDKAKLDQAALGAQFCKLAHASGIDPWVAAINVVKNYSAIAKMASAEDSKAQELSKFYVDWANNLITTVAHGGR